MIDTFQMVYQSQTSGLIKGKKMLLFQPKLFSTVIAAKFIKHSTDPEGLHAVEMEKFMFFLCEN